MTASGLGAPSGGGERTLPKSSLAVLAVCTDTVPGIGSGSVHTPCESPYGASIWKGCVLGVVAGRTAGRSVAKEKRERRKCRFNGKSFSGGFGRKRQWRSVFAKGVVFVTCFSCLFTTFAESSDVFEWGNGVEKGNWAEGGFTPWQSLCFFFFFLSFFFLLLFLPMLQCSMYETKKLSLDSTPAQFSCSVMPFRV